MMTDNTTDNKELNLVKRFACRVFEKRTIWTLAPSFVLDTAQLDETVPIWLAVGISTVVVCSQYYRSTFRPGFPSWNWLDSAQFFSLLGAGIVHAIVQIDFYILQPIPAASMFVAAIISIIVKDNCIYHGLKGEKDPEFFANPQVKKLTQAGSAFWAICFF